MQADLFTFLYKETGSTSWFELARKVFKDGILYSKAEFTPINLDPSPEINGFPETPKSAWLKEGKIRHKPMFYLHVEWLLQPDPGLPAAPTGFRIKWRSH